MRSTYLHLAARSGAIASRRCATVTYKGLGQMLSKLSKISEEFNASYKLRWAPIISSPSTSQGCYPYYQPSAVSVPGVLRSTLSTHYSTPSAADPGATMTFVAGGALKPIGGHILSHASATRIFLRKGVSHQFVSSISAHCAALTPCRFELNIF